MAYQKKSYEERKAEIDKAFSDIETQVPKIFESDAFKSYLDFASSFHSYSINNQLLIRMQKPESTLVTGYRSWQEKGRQVNKGEKGIRILAPSSYKKNKEVEKTDADGNVVYGADGKPETETRQVTIQTFTTVSVFDVSQTSGEPIPELVHNLEGNSKEAVNLLESVEQVCDAPISYHGKEDPIINGGANGYFSSKTGNIVVSSDNAIDQQAKTLIHEWAHQRLHSDDTGKSKNQREIEAEATAYVVSKHFGLNTGDYSFNYVGAYAAGKDTKELKSLLDDIHTNAHEMIDKIEEVYEQIQEKNKNVSIEDLLQGRSHEEPASEVTADAKKPITEETSVEEPVPDNAETETNEPAETKKKEGIQDFGEKIGGAKKDLWKEAGLTLNDLDSLNEAERAALIKKNNVWPKPDYQAMKDSGIPVEVVFYIKNVRDSLAAAPVTNKFSTNDNIHKEQERYIRFVSTIRDDISACKTMDDVKGMKDCLVDRGFATKEFYFMTPTEAGGRYVTNKLLKAIQADENELKKKIDKKAFLMNDDDKLIAKSRFGLMEIDTSKMDITDERITIRNGYSSTYLYPQKTADMSKAEDKTWVITEGSHVLYTGFESEEAAKSTLLAALKLVNEGKEEPEEKKQRKTSLKPPILAHIERTGPDYREKEATGQDYLDTFGFRGGEFGNWLNEKERQGNLDMGYDAFKDLGKALNISDKDVALNGRLSIAFGARGSGKALAHYEPLREVINLTKLKGAGSLGHEWIHAMDDIVGKSLGIKGMMSEANGIDRKKVPESFKNLMDTIEYKKITTVPEKKAIAEEALARDRENFKNGLHAISRSWGDEAKDAKREELINNCVENVGTPKWNDAINEFKDFQLENGDGNPSSSRNAKWLDAQNNVFSIRIKNVEHPEQMSDIRVVTDFKKNAEELDGTYSKSGHGYWASPCEMLARAGAVYIAEKCKEQGIKDDYLSGHADNWSGKASTVPNGEERTAINKAFDTFFDDMRTRGIFKEAAEPSLDDLDSVIENAQRIADAQQKSASKPPIARESELKKE